MLFYKRPGHTVVTVPTHCDEVPVQTGIMLRYSKGTKYDLWDPYSTPEIKTTKHTEGSTLIQTLIKSKDGSGHVKVGVVRFEW